MKNKLLFLFFFISLQSFSQSWYRHYQTHGIYDIAITGDAIWGGSDQLLKSEKGPICFLPHALEGFNTTRVVAISDDVIFTNNEVSYDGGDTWIDVTIPNTEHGFFMVDSMLGLASGGGQVKYTDDGWKSNKSAGFGRMRGFTQLASGKVIGVGEDNTFAAWIQMYDTSSINNPTTVHNGVGSDRLFWVTETSTKILAGGSAGTLLESLDSGNTWNQITTTIGNISNPGFAQFQDFHAIDQNTFIAVISSTTENGVYKSTDGGINWTQVLSTAEVTNFEFENTLHGFAFGRHAIYETKDGGQNWMEKSTRQHDNLNFIGFEQTNKQFGVISGDYGSVMYSQDGGANWKKAQGIDDSKDYYGVAFKDASTAIMTGQKTYRTSDKGETWTELNIGSNSTFSTIHYLGNNSYLIGLDKISTDGGDTWTDFDNQGNFGKFFPISDQEFIISGLEIYKSSDGGNTWSTVETGIGSTYGINFHSATEGFAVGDHLWKTTDGGDNWTDLGPHGYTPKSQPTAIEAAFDGANGIYLFNKYDDSLRISLDGGTTWFSQEAELRATHIFFSDGGYGYMVDESSIIANTDNICSIGGGGNPIGVSESIKENSSELFVYPNPAQDQLFLEGIGVGQLISIYNIQGTLIKKIIFEDAPISIEDLTKGFYFIRTNQDALPFIKM